VVAVGVTVAVADADEVADAEEVAVAVADAEEVAVAVADTEEVAVAVAVADAEDVAVAVGETNQCVSAMPRNRIDDVEGREYTTSSFCKSRVSRVRVRPVRIQTDEVSVMIRLIDDVTVVNGRLPVRFQIPLAELGDHTSRVGGALAGTMYSWGAVEGANA
jgi:hypothetical protein